MGRLGLNAVRLNHTAGDANNHQNDQRHRKRNAASERIDRAIALALVGQHVVKPGAQVVNDQREERDDECSFHLDAMQQTSPIIAVPRAVKMKADSR